MLQMLISPDPSPQPSVGLWRHQGNAHGKVNFNHAFL